MLKSIWVIELDKIIGRVQYILRRPVILRQDHLLLSGKSLLNERMFSNDAPLHRKIAWSSSHTIVIVVLERREELDELVLATVCILELIDKEESKCTSRALQNMRPLAKETECLYDQIAEIHRIMF